jgi:hypothetical protein
MRLLLALALGAGLFPAVVAAQPAPPGSPSSSARPDGASPPAASPPPAPRRPAILSVTFTPLALPWEIFELTRPNVFAILAVSLELRAHPKFGIAVMGLAGDETDTFISARSHDTFFEIGAEPRWYLRGDFRGWMAGAALHYFRMHIVVTDLLGGFDYDPFDFAGYALGAFFGYKYTAPIGFTVEVKGGVETIKRTMSDRGSHPDILPITDVKVGWSF